MNNLNPSTLLADLHAKAVAEGLSTVGVVSVPVELRRDYYFQWLDGGQHGEMAWMARDPERRTHPEQVLTEARSILAFGLNYYQPEPDRRGRIAKYALGKDYHKVFLKKLKRICLWLQGLGAVNRPYVDTGPLLEKPLAELAGLGWQGKNTMLLNKEHGQWLFLGFILTSQSFEASARPGQSPGPTSSMPVSAFPI
jgi:epoxyqueuosine reductase